MILPLLIAALPQVKPNIVVIVGDDLGYNENSIYGGKGLQTPNIASIAKNGVRFTSGYVTGPVCSPTRAGLLTGRYQQRFGHEFNFANAEGGKNGLPTTEITLARRLKNSGYHTIAIGKWHLGYQPKFHPLSRGFDEYYGFLSGARSYFPIKGNGNNAMLRGRERATENFQYLTDELASEASKYIEASKAKPFFLYLTFNATHTPLNTKSDDLRAANGKKVQAMTIALDRGVGTVLESLKKAGLSDNTLVFFISDNGGPGGHDNAPLRGNKGSTWEGGIRVPFVLQWPSKVPGNQVVGNPVISLDIAATALAAAGIKGDEKLEGVNLLPFVGKNALPAPGRPLFWRFGSQWAVRDGQYKLVSAGKSPSEVMLFDLEADPGEAKDLSAEKPEVKTRLQKLWDDWNKKNVAPLWRGS